MIVTSIVDVVMVEVVLVLLVVTGVRVAGIGVMCPVPGSVALGWVPALGS
ncbi:hypothetical protein LWP59_10620 [Amycolatopsis acidiphila]|nr:hypothetical protein [Amycolatopsis acidiphila]UIJ62038.1 hypothetical protein LWP59_10620 [Amycolatopsis acidiphila]